MAQIFHPSTNTVSRLTIFGGLFFLASLTVVTVAINRSSYYSKAGVARHQPVPFSHKHHVQGVGLDCRYCHWSVEESAFAGIPPTSLCMNCHRLLWNDAPILEPVRESFRTDASIEWIRVHDVPDFVYFDHSIHVAKGVACVTCHGQVDEMPLMWREHTLFMEWCLDCHRRPEEYLRPREEVFNTAWEPTDNTARLGEELVKAYNVNVEQLDDCSVCHR